MLKTTTTPSGFKVYALDHQDGGRDFFEKINLALGETALILIPNVNGKGTVIVSDVTVAVTVTAYPEADVIAEKAQYSLIDVSLGYADFSSPFTAFKLVAPAAATAAIRFRMAL